MPILALVKLSLGQPKGTSSHLIVRYNSCQYYHCKKTSNLSTHNEVLSVLATNEAYMVKSLLEHAMILQIMMAPKWIVYIVYFLSKEPCPRR